VLFKSIWLDTEMVYAPADGHSLIIRRVGSR